VSEPHYSGQSVTLYQCDARSIPIPDGSVQCCVTSPPYWGLRDYGSEGQLGLEETPGEYVSSMVDVFREVRRVLRDDGTLWLNLAASYFGSPTPGAASGGKSPTPSHAPSRAPAYGNDGKAPEDCSANDPACLDFCDGCRAATLPRRDTSRHRRSASSSSGLTASGAHSDSGAAPLGASLHGARASTTPRSSAPHPAECSHCANCDACLSVLRSSTRDARLCARMAESTIGSGPPSLGGRSLGTDASGMAWLKYTTFKQKDMVPIPWMVAMALQADGWYLRSDIIWSKPNPMPESVTDRPTKAHEYLFLLSKSARYHYDADAIRETADPDSYRASKRNKTAWADHGQGVEGRYNQALCRGTSQGANPAGRNKRSVWTVATQPYPGAHFAVFPPKLITPCILAGTSAHGCCSECGAPWVREVERGALVSSGPNGLAEKPRSVQRRPGAEPLATRPKDGYGDLPRRERTTTGWAPTCDHAAPVVPCTVLDPFVGSGTTAWVAKEHGRKAIGCDLSAEYLELAAARLRQGVLAL